MSHVCNQPYNTAKMSHHHFISQSPFGFCTPYCRGGQHNLDKKFNVLTHWFYSIFSLKFEALIGKLLPLRSALVFHPSSIRNCSTL